MNLTPSAPLPLPAYFPGRQDIVWDLVNGGDHDKEERSLTRKKALAILDWLAEHPRGARNK